MAAPTRAEVEEVLIRRAGALMNAADLDGGSIDGTNEDLADPIAYSLRQLNHPPAKILHVNDADLAVVTIAELDQLFDVAELRLLMNIAGHLDDVDLTIGDRSERFSQLKAPLEKRIASMEARVSRLYQIGEGALTPGVIRVNFQETHPT